ncbi:ParM/StbA family protein [Clostridioides difficile]|uniref:ParM/StbA family protein n=1 Tax=Clostridioides difficile TaxID=1496 RepID=UPI000D1E8209|nr:ParM/StbA family protein [Clostridioides difficile]
MCITIDAGNGNIKIIAGDKKIIDCSNIKEVSSDTFGAWTIGDKSYLIGQGVRGKISTNKITDSRKGVIARMLYPLVEEKETIDVNVLLPLSLYFDKQNREDMIKLLSGNYKVTNPDGYTKGFKIKTVDIYPESFSSLFVEPELLKKPCYLVDIGNYDLSMVYVDRVPSQDKLHTDVKGMAVLYKDLSRVLTSKLRRTIDEGNAKLMLEKYDSLQEDVKAVIDNFMNDYIQTNIYDRLEEIHYDNLIHDLVLTGGGAIAISKWLKDDNITILKDALWSNVEGAKIVSTRKKGAK